MIAYGVNVDFVFKISDNNCCMLKSTMVDLCSMDGIDHKELTTLFFLDQDTGCMIVL